MRIKLLILLSANQIRLYEYGQNQMGPPLVITNNSDGIDRLNGYLKNGKKYLTNIIFDLIEEEFKHDTIPHVYGNDRHNLIHRKLNHLFHNTPYRQGIVQEREKQGRRDDKVLLTAVTNPELISPCTLSLHQNKIPVEGIYSISFLSESLIKNLNIAAPNLLILTLQHSGLRLSYFQNRILKISRLSNSVNPDDPAFAEHINKEIEKTERYLVRLHLLTREMELSIGVVGHESFLEINRNAIQEKPGHKILFIDLQKKSKILGSGSVENGLYSDDAFAHFFFKAKPKGNYADLRDLHYFRLNQYRLAINTFSFFVLFSSLAWSGMNFIDGIVLKQFANQATQKIEKTTNRYNSVLEFYPEIPIDPLDLKQGVELSYLLKKNTSSPIELFYSLSAALQNFPQLQINSIDWIVSNNPDEEFTDVKKKKKKQKKSHDLYQIALVEGEIKPFDGSFPDAFRKINLFIDDLGQRKEIQHVSSLRLPLNISSNSNLSGASGMLVKNEQATFSIRVVLKVDNETKT